ncbi:MAG: lipopolysaccharide heptosyltransferase II [Fibrobacter sp.]|nr:lipopolysaccharide heptosyltransferase II [Fibrobacter sp.]
MNQYKNILIIQTAFLGDVILITPLIRAARQLFCDDRIDILTLPQNGSILSNNPHINNVIYFDKRKNKVKAFFHTLSTIRKNKYDLAISPHSSTTSALLMYLGGIKERLGFDRWHASRYLTMKVPHLTGIHKIDKNLHLLSVFSDKKFDSQTELFFDKEKAEFFENKINDFFNNKRPVIALAPGSVWFTKRWPVNRYIELSRLLGIEGYNLVFIGAPDERNICSEIIYKAQVPSLNFAGETSPIDSAALLSCCDLLVCNDSGAMHIANAVKTDVVAFFGPTVKRIGYYPFRENDTVMEIDLKCRPCGGHGGKFCPLGHFKCMNDIPVKGVLAAIKKHFDLKTEESL